MLIFVFVKAKAMMTAGGSGGADPPGDGKEPHRDGHKEIFREDSQEDEEEEETPHGALLRTFRWCRTCDKQGYISKGAAATQSARCTGASAGRNLQTQERRRRAHV